MWGVVTYFSAPKIRTAYTTVLKNNPDTLVLATYLTIILDRRSQLLQDFSSFPTTSGQLSSKAVKIGPKYFNYDIISSSVP